MTLHERRSHVDIPFGFLTFVFAIVAWRGWANARGAAIAFAIGAVGLVVIWVVIRRKPFSTIEVTTDAIVWSRPGNPTIRFDRGDGQVHLHRHVDVQAVSHWTLTRPGVGVDHGIDLFGYDVFEFRTVCEQHGWTVTS